MTGYDIYDAGFEEGVEAALDYIEAMEASPNRDAATLYRIGADFRADRQNGWRDMKTAYTAKDRANAQALYKDAKRMAHTKYDRSKGYHSESNNMTRVGYNDGRYGYDHYKDRENAARAGAVAGELKHKAMQASKNGQYAMAKRYNTTASKIADKYNSSSETKYAFNRGTQYGRARSANREAGVPNRSAKEDVMSTFDFSDFEDGFVDFMTDNYYDDYDM